MAPPIRSEMEDIQEALRRAQRHKRKLPQQPVATDKDGGDSDDGAPATGDAVVARAEKAKRAKRASPTKRPSARPAKRGEEDRAPDAASAAAAPGRKRAARRASAAAAAEDKETGHVGDEAISLNDSEGDSGAEMDMTAHTRAAVEEELSRALAREREAFARERAALELQVHKNKSEVLLLCKMREEAEAVANHYRALSRNFAETASTGKRAGGGTGAASAVASSGASGMAASDVAREAPAAKRAAAASADGRRQPATAAVAEKGPSSTGAARDDIAPSAGQAAGAGSGTSQLMTAPMKSDPKICVMSRPPLFSHTALPCLNLCHRPSSAGIPTRRRQPLRTHLTEAIAARNAALQRVCPCDIACFLPPFFGLPGSPSLVPKCSRPFEVSMGRYSTSWNQNEPYI